ncbi:poly(R)-hydroxyalkanoic acid synthase subunit PhaE [Candidatus Poriferisodalis sp.]|uniref:poly(R)-hydroxyalkanoic acid synthase subunit PhaE n=1 Tax=Candidatus Poriferisodalis sp. TaxID=3101277 RepID=UPI003B01A411
MAKQWREIYNEWEKAVAPGLQQFAASDGFRDFMAASAKVTNALTAEFERASRRWLHFWNLPAATDVRKLRQQVAAVDRELKSLKNLVFDVVAADTGQATNGQSQTAAKSTARKTVAKKPAARKPAAAAEAS